MKIDPKNLLKLSAILVPYTSLIIFICYKAFTP